jgi:nucleotide-binding universal stress UspA family protein
MSVPQNFLVPVVATEASLDAVTIAALIAKPKKGRVYVAHIIEVNRSLPLNAELDAEARRGEQLIRRAEEIALEGAGYAVTGTLLQAREAGPAIVEEAIDHEIDAIVIGVPPAVAGGSGRTIDYVMKHATCSVWVVRQSTEPGKLRSHE